MDIKQSNSCRDCLYCTRSPKELLLAKEPYHARFKKSLEEDVAYHTTGDFRKILVPLDLKDDPKDEFLAILRATVKCFIFPEKYFEKVIRLGINKLGTDEGAVSRVVATRAEVDMNVIKELYEKRNSVPLAKAIDKDTHGDYEKMLLTIIGHPQD